MRRWTRPVQQIHSSRSPKAVSGSELAAACAGAASAASCGGLSAPTLGGCAPKPQPPPAARARFTLGITMLLSGARGCASAARLRAAQAPSRSLTLPSAARRQQPSRRVRPVQVMAASSEVRPPVVLAHAWPRARVLTPGRAQGTAEVERINGVRLIPLEGQKAMRVEYLIKWKDNAPDSWCGLRWLESARFALRPYRRVVAHRCWRRRAGSRRATWRRTCCASSRRAGGPARARARSAS